MTHFSLRQAKVCNYILYTTMYCLLIFLDLYIVYLILFKSFLLIEQSSHHKNEVKTPREVLTLPAVNPRIMLDIGFQVFCQILTIILVKTMFTMWKSMLELNLQWFSYLTFKSAFSGKPGPFHFSSATVCKICDHTFGFVSPTYLFPQLTIYIYSLSTMWSCFLKSFLVLDEVKKPKGKLLWHLVILVQEVVGCC